MAPQRTGVLLSGICWFELSVERVSKTSAHRADELQSQAIDLRWGKSCRGAAGVATCQVAMRGVEPLTQVASSLMRAVGCLFAVSTRRLLVFVRESCWFISTAHMHTRFA